jgi:hypothetical protein
MALEDCLGQVRITSFGKPGEDLNGQFEWGYTVYAGTFQLYATKARRVDAHYELILEFTLNHEGATFPEKRLRIIDLDKVQEADWILKTQAEEKAKYVAERTGLKYVGHV